MPRTRRAAAPEAGGAGRGSTRNPGSDQKREPWRNLPLASSAHRVFRLIFFDFTVRAGLTGNSHISGVIRHYLAVPFRVTTCNATFILLLPCLLANRATQLPGRIAFFVLTLCFPSDLNGPLYLWLVVLHGGCLFPEALRKGLRSHKSENTQQMMPLASPARVDTVIELFRRIYCILTLGQSFLMIMEVSEEADEQWRWSPEFTASVNCIFWCEMVIYLKKYINGMRLRTSVEQI